MYSNTFKAFEERANAFGLFIEISVVTDNIRTGALSLTLTDDNGRRMQRLESLNEGVSIQETHEKLYIETLCEYFGEEVPSITEEAEVTDSIPEYTTNAGGVPPVGFSLAKDEESSEEGIATPEVSETVSEVESDGYGEDFESQARIFEKCKDKHFSALIANPDTRILIKKLMGLTIQIKDSKAKETREKGEAYLKKHGIVL